MNARMEQLAKWLQEKPTDSFLRFALALEFMKEGELDESLHFFEALLKDDPDYTGTYYHLGKLLEKLNRKDAAINIYQAGIEKTRLKDRHANSELKEALLLLSDSNDE